jgi:trans-aconitate methyltransferase
MSFDREYFDRFYNTQATAVYGAEEIDRLCRGITGFVELVQAPLDTILDAGAGTGLVRDWFRAHRPQAKVRSVDVSEYACATYGHERRDLATWCEDTKFDLILCNGVLAYLDDEACGKAIDNLAQMSSSFLYVSVTTNEDLFFGTVGERSDHEGMVLRPAAFYRERLLAHYVEAGLGLFYRRSAPLRLRALERYQSP